MPVASNGFLTRTCLHAISWLCQARSWLSSHFANKPATRLAPAELVYGEQQARLNICDRGVGFGVAADLLPPRGWGLAGMRERAESIGGEFVVLSMPGEGTEVSIVVPLVTTLVTPEGEGVHE